MVEDSQTSQPPSPAETLDEQIIRDLADFCRDNNPAGLVADMDPAEVDNATLGRFLLFAAGHAKGNPGLPRTLEAHRLVWAVPQDVGSRAVDAWLAERNGADA